MIKHDYSPRVYPDIDDCVPKRGPGRIVSANAYHGRPRHHRLWGNRDDKRFLERGEGLCTNPVPGLKVGVVPGVTALRQHSGDTRCGIDPDVHFPRWQRLSAVESTQATQGRKAPFFFPPGWDWVFRTVLVQPGNGGRGLHGPLQSGHQPTAPSICSSMSRFSSRAYSIGSSRAIGSTKPRTMVAAASSSVMPRLLR